MTKKQKGASKLGPWTKEDDDALRDMSPAELARQQREAYPEDYPSVHPTEAEVDDEIVDHEIALQELRDRNGGMLGGSFTHEMTPEGEAEGNRLVDEVIEADRRAAEGR